MRVLVDNDVVLNFILQRTPFDQEAKEVFIKGGAAIVVMTGV